MAKLLGFLALLSYITGVSAEVCSTGNSYYYYYYNYYYTKYIYCEHGCCGYNYDRECCEGLNAGTIAGIVIGILLFFAFIAVITFVIKKCTTNRTGVVMAGPTSAPGGNVTVVTAQQPQMMSGGYAQPAYPQPQYGALPHGGAAYPPPAYPPPQNVPGQPVTH